jgi:hypothetical protein
MARQTTQNAKSAANDIRSLFDPQGYRNAFKSLAGANERLTGIMVGAASKTTDITSETTHEALSNVRDVSQVRDEAADYGKACSDFAQKQVDLFVRTAKAYAEVGRKAGTEAADLAAEAGADAGSKAAANAEAAADKAGSAARKAA